VEQATLSLAGDGASADRMLAIDLRRADVQSALDSAGEGPVDLLLEIASRDAEGGGDEERHTLSVECTIADLERLLATSDDDIRVGFDAEALERAIREPDIEAHGLREKMAVLAVVVATTGSVVGTAQAMPAHNQSGGTGTAVTDVRDMPADSMIASQGLGPHAGQMASPGIIESARAAQPGAGLDVRDMASDTLAATAASQSGAPVHDMASDTLAAAAASQSGAPVHDMASDTLAAAAASQSGAAVHDMASDTLAAAAASQSGAAVHDMASDTLAASAATQSGAPVHDMASDTLAASSATQPGPPVARDTPADSLAASTSAPPPTVARDFPGENAAGQPVLADSSKAPPVASHSGGIQSSTDVTPFVVVGGIALALVGAAFAAAGVSRRAPKPS
jgi:hypothetical protein